MDYDKHLTFIQKQFINLGYATYVPVTLVILISLFGRVKLNYRWFILNQAVIDLFLNYNFICIKFGYNLSRNCSFGFYEEGNQIMQILPAIGLLLLSGSRFLHVYFVSYFQWNKAWKIVLYILLIDVAFILAESIPNFLNSWQSEKHMKCLKWILNEYEYTSGNITCGKNITTEIRCSYLNRENYELCMKDLSFDTAHLLYSHYKTYVLPLIYPITLAMSIILVLLLVARLLKHVRVQAALNKAAFLVNLRIIIVLSIQTIFLFILGSMEIVHTAFYKTFQLQPLPSWLRWLYNNEQTTLIFREIRVFTDSLIILGFMSGYREDLRDTILWLFKKLKKIKILKIKGKRIKNKFEAFSVY